MAANAENAPAWRADAFQRLSNSDVDNQRVRQNRQGPQARILEFKPFEKNTLRGFFSLELASGMILSGCTLHESRGKFWVGMPGKPYAKPDGSQSWVKIVDFRDKATGYRFQQMIVPLAVEAWQKAEVAA